MTEATLMDALHLAGYRPREVTPELLREGEAALAQAASQPLDLLIRWLKARRDCARVHEAAKELKGILDGLLAAETLLCRCEGVVQTARGPRALVLWQGRELRELSIHPEIAVATVAALEPWQWVEVEAKEHVVVGVLADAAAFLRAQGDVVELRAFESRAAGLVRVAHTGGREEVVRLARPLQAASLVPCDRLVLSRDAPGWAIARAQPATGTSRFEQPIEDVQLLPEEIAGVDDVLGPLLEQIELRLLRSDLQNTFALEPLHGVLLWSLQAGTGKTLVTRALATFLHRAGKARGFETVLYVVKPNALKSMWHGEDARLVREDLCGAIAARQRQPREQPLLQLVVMDEIDALGRRAGGHDGTVAWSGAHNDAIQALLVELDGMTRTSAATRAQVLWLGLTNRPDAVDPALKRPGRFGDLVLEMPPLTVAAAEAIMAVYARNGMPCFVDGATRTDLSLDEIRQRLLRPALQRVFGAVVLRYGTDAERAVDVAAGSIMSAVRYREAMSLAKAYAARRGLVGEGLAALGADDVFAGLVEQACAAARELEADRLTLERCLRVRGRIHRVDVVSRDDVAWDRDLRQPA